MGLRSVKGRTRGAVWLGTSQYLKNINLRLQLEMRVRSELETEVEVDGRWIAEIPSIAGVMAYGATEAEAREKVQTLALLVFEDQHHGS